MIYRDKVVECSMDGCCSPAEYGALEDGHRHEWFYCCQPHKKELEEEINFQIRPIEECPPFCDELTVKLSPQAKECP